MKARKRANLENTLTSLPEPSKLPTSLPLAHLTFARYFESIVTAAGLEPRKGDVFKEKLIYLFYGGVMYRTSNRPTRHASELPVVLVFHPYLLKVVDRYYPFDTGALAKGYYRDWGPKLGVNARGYKLAGRGDFKVPSRLVYHLYKSNKRYLTGMVDPSVKGKPEPFPQLFDFLKADLTKYGVDHRQLSIEAHCTKPISFEHLLWVGFPEQKTKQFQALFRKLYDLVAPTIPRFCAYESNVIFTPNEIARELHSIAKKDVIEQFVQLPGDK